MSNINIIIDWKLEYFLVHKFLLNLFSSTRNPASVSDKIMRILFLNYL